MPSTHGLPLSWKVISDEGEEGVRILLRAEVSNAQRTQAYVDLYEWVKESAWAGVEVIDFDYGTTRDVEYRHPYHVRLVTNKALNQWTEEVNFNPPKYATDNTSTVCVGCYIWGIPLSLGTVPGSQSERMYCASCNPKCTGCGSGNLVTKYRTGEWSPRSRNMPTERNTLCETCQPTVKCRGCNSQIRANSPFLTTIEVDGAKYQACQKCVHQYICKECNAWAKLRRPGGSCNGCFAKQFDKIINDDPKFAVGSLPAGGLLFPDMPARPFRTVSIETEMDGDREALATVLYACGIIQNPRVEDYHSNPDASAEWMCHLKHDGTATAGELISHLLELNDKDHAEGLVSMLRRLRGLEKMGLIQYGSGCGGHIHIDAHNYDWNDVYRLFTIFGYMEDVIYRLAGSGSSFGHRSLDKGGRTANGVAAGSYSKPIRKGPFGSLENFVMTMKGEGDRGMALNLQPYTQAIGNCRCQGGRHGKLKFCTCNLGKATIEWRIWNSTGNPRILHAWIAIMQAMHAFCEGEGEPSNEWLNQYPAFAYTGKKWINNHASHADTAKQRVEWMLREFVFTPEERKSILYAIEASEMEGMFNLRERNMYLKMDAQDLPPKATPRNPVRRERKIKIHHRTPEEIKRVKAAPLG